MKQLPFSSEFLILWYFLNKKIHTVKVKFLDLSWFQNLFLSFQSFGLVGKIISLCLKFIDDSLIISNFAKQLSIDNLFIKILSNQCSSIRYSLDSIKNTVAVLMVLKASSTILNLFISDSILFLSILLTKAWVKWTILQCFYDCILSWIALDAISDSSNYLWEFMLLRVSFS